MPVTTTNDVSMPLPDGTTMTGAIALPDLEWPRPGMLVLHEMFGLNADMRRITGRFADNGYVALAPNLYSHGNKALCLSRVIMDGRRGGGRTLDDIEAARRYLAQRAEVDSDRIGVVGFCMGGGFALLVGARPGVEAAGVNYGEAPKDRSRLEGMCPVVASYGGMDRFFAKMPERLRQHLDALGVPHDIKVYPDVGHSFLSYDNAPGWMARIPTGMHVGYSEAAAEDAWERMLAWFAKYLG